VEVILEPLKIPSLQNVNNGWQSGIFENSLIVDTAVFSIDTVLKTSYLFLDRCFIFLERCSDPDDKLVVYFSLSGSSDLELDQVIGEFGNRLIWQQVRQSVAAETAEIRNLIVAQAFTEADMEFGETHKEAYRIDPLDISK
jgi:His-Xaa-Ser system protein HxsD